MAGSGQKAWRVGPSDPHSCTATGTHPISAAGDLVEHQPACHSRRPGPVSERTSPPRGAPTGRARAAIAAVVAAVVAAGAAIAVVPARADTPLSGIYALNSSAEPGSTWTITSACTPSCTAHVRSSRGWDGFAFLTIGQWRMTLYRGHLMRSAYPPDPVDCVSDDSTAALTQTWSWDVDTLMGDVETVHGDQCGGSPTLQRTAVSLVRAD
jgi:hypothetical protein